MAIVLLGAAAQGCSSVRCQWRDTSLRTPQPAQAATVLPKRLAVVGWAPQTAHSDAGRPAEVKPSPLAHVLAQVAADFVKLHRNYIVYETRAIQQNWAEACGGKIEGVLLVRALGVAAHTADTVALDLAAEIYRCGDGALIWRAEGDGVHTARDSELTVLTDSYVADLGEVSRPYVAPAFGLLQALFDVLPDVQLTEGEVSEKIELGDNRHVTWAHPAAMAQYKRIRTPKIARAI